MLHQLQGTTYRLCVRVGGWVGRGGGGSWMSHLRTLQSNENYQTTDRNEGECCAVALPLFAGSARNVCASIYHHVSD